jgi:ABC-type uncharacterized transport system YnjBCD ATPase subunit
MVEQTLRSVRLTEQRHVTPHLLSGGQQRRLALAIALVGDSKVQKCSDTANRLLYLLINCCTWMTRCQYVYAIGCCAG